MLPAKLNELKHRLSEFTALVERMLEKSINGLMARDKNVLREIISRDEPKANMIEIEIDEECTTLIARFEPKARDLRTVLMALKMNNDLERIGDHAVNIAGAGLYLTEKSRYSPFDLVPEMAEIVTGMLKDSITSFIEENPDLARDVCGRDRRVNRLRDRILDELTSFMKKDQARIRYALHVIRISGNLERIADLSTNICEDIIFIEEGRVIKHHRPTRENGPAGT